jgi:arginyl-tRNA synthetase
MNYAYDRLRQQATQIISGTELVPAEAVSLVQPKPNIPADLAFPVFGVAKAAGGGNPAEFAKRLAGAATVPEDSLVGKVEPAGGFVNISVHPERFAQAVLDEALALGDAFGRDADVGADGRSWTSFPRPTSPARCTSAICARP